MADAHIHVVIEKLLLVHLDQVLVGSGAVGVANHGGGIHVLHVAIVHQLVLFNNVLRCGVVYLEHLGCFFYRHTLSLHYIN